MNYKNRRDQLLDLVRTQHASYQGTIVLFSPCDSAYRSFVQESNFYYFSGIIEPASVMVISQDKQVFYKPAYTDTRAQWVDSAADINQNNIQEQGFDDLQVTGKIFPSVHVYPYFDYATYENITALLSDLIRDGKKIFTIYPSNSYQAIEIRAVVDRLAQVIPNLHDHIIDISAQTAQLRRKKEMVELELLYKTAEITANAHQAAMHMLKQGRNEAEVQATLEFVFAEQGACAAYPSIVAGGPRGTILHYSTNNQPLLDGQLVVVDAGARYNYYCADVTRTYPVSGKFTAEQKELYELVLECQELVAEQAKPGMWLSNKDEQELSLHHIALNFFKKHGYEKYFTHSIGHFLGLDVHDVGDVSRPLQEGDIITIEPGLYIPEKQLGIRIEDNYWIVDQTTPVCLSEAIPKSIQAVEEMVQQSFDVDL